MKPYYTTPFRLCIAFAALLCMAADAKDCTDTKPTTPNTPGQGCVITQGEYTWSCEGKLDDTQYDCKPIEEPADGDFQNNWLCIRKGGPSGAAFQWSYAGPIDGLSCVQVYENAEPSEHAWGDNYICNRKSSTGLGSVYRFQWSEAGPIPGKECLQWLEPKDPHTWNDNYLCWDRF